MPIDYLRLAVDSPAVQAPSVWIYPKTQPAAPAVLYSLTGADMTERFNSNAWAVEALGRAGALGAYYVRFGLDLSSGGGLVCNVSAGQALLDAPVTVPADTTLPGGLADNTTNFVWVSRGGVLNKRTLADSPNHLLPPDSSVPWAYLGAVPAAAGVQGNPDYSGRVYAAAGGGLERRTADIGAPTDTPSAGVRFRNLSQDAPWEWNGTVYTAVGGSAAFALSKRTIAVGEVAAVPAGYQVVVSELTVNGTLQVNGLLRVVP